MLIIIIIKQIFLKIFNQNHSKQNFLKKSFIKKIKSFIKKIKSFKKKSFKVLRKNTFKMLSVA